MLINTLLGTYKRLEHGGATVREVQFFPDRTQLATGGEDGKIKVFQCASQY